VQHTDGPTRRRTVRRAWFAGLSVAVAVAVVGAATAAFGAPLFTDDFEDGNTTGWSASGGSWSVVTDGSGAYRQSSTSSDARSLAGQSTWGDYAVQARVKPIAFNGTDRFAAVVARAQSNTSYYYLALRSSNRVELRKVVGGSSTTLAAASVTVTAGTWYTLRLEVAGSTLRGFVNGTQLVSGTDSTYTTGRIGLATYNTSASFDDVLVDPAVAPTATASVTPSVTPSATPSVPPSSCANPPQIVGFASVNAWGRSNTTGGCGGPTVTVTTAAQLLDYIARSGSYIIQVQGMITLPGPMHDVTSNKTIIGIGATSGVTGGGFNIGIPVDDAINVQMFSHHVWLDHNDLSNGYDGLIDIKRGSSYVTVSWNHTHHHTKTMLLGHDDGAGAQDIGRLKVTYHHNWFDQTPQRNPRVRFGEPVHVFNNYYLHNTDVGVACQANAGCVVEGNVFENTEEAYLTNYAGPSGRMVARNNVFIGESFPGQTGGTVQEPNTYYSYTVDDPNSIKASVTAGAGVGKI